MKFRTDEEEEEGRGGLHIGLAEVNLRTDEEEENKKKKKKLEDDNRKLSHCPSPL